MSSRSVLLDALLVGLREFQAREAAILNNPDLSPVGRQNQMTALRNEVQTFRAKATDYLRLSAATFRLEYERHQAKALLAEDHQGQRWDYGRLSFESQSAKAALQQAPDLGAAARIFHQWVALGDAHRVRAMTETAPEVLKARFGASFGLEVDQLARESAQRLAVVMDTDELKQLRAEGSDLVKAALELQKTVFETSGFYDPRIGLTAGLGSTDEFTRLLDGIHLTSKWTDEGGPASMAYTLEVEPTAEQPVSGRPEESYAERFTRLSSGGGSVIKSVIKES